jgi:hypothetical protein
MQNRISKSARREPSPRLESEMTRMGRTESEERSGGRGGGGDRGRRDHSVFGFLQLLLVQLGAHLVQCACVHMRARVRACARSCLLIVTYTMAPCAHVCALERAEDFALCAAGLQERVIIPPSLPLSLPPFPSSLSPPLTAQCAIISDSSKTSAHKSLSSPIAWETVSVGS